MAERFCGMANAQGGIVIIGVEDPNHTIVGVPDDRIGTTFDMIVGAARQVIKSELVPNPKEKRLKWLANLS